MRLFPALFSSLVVLFLVGMVFPAWSQYHYPEENIISKISIEDDKAKERRQRIVDQANSLATLSIDTSQWEIENALWSVGQFLVQTPGSDKGFDRLMKNWNKLERSVQISLLEAVYAIYPEKYVSEMRRIAETSDHKRTVAIALSYLKRQNPAQWATWQRILNSRFPNYNADLFLQRLHQHLGAEKPGPLPSFDSLFAHQHLHKYKIVYSFQRPNRDYPGLAVVQEADGFFARDSTDHLLAFAQLARSANNLPFFITHGSTPQGLFAITGTDISRSPYIGPTPNLQTPMMYEVTPPIFTHYFPMVFSATPEAIYRSYFPQNWQNWSGLMEAHDAGKIGRSAIIAHGTTIEKTWFEGMPWYPFTPTMGCLSIYEDWNPETGKLASFEQLHLVNTFLRTEGTKGYMMVINLEDKDAPVSVEEVEALIRPFESRLQKGY